MAVKKIPYRATSGVAKDDLTNVTTGFPIRQNKVRNGCFRINQRAKAGTVTLAAGEYGHDGWKGGASGCTYTFAASNEVVTLTISAGSLVQVIEGGDLETGTHTMSWTGTAQGKIGAGSLSASGVTGSVTGGSNLNIEFGTGTLAKVKLEKGAFATAFEMRNTDDELRLCQRYCIVLGGDNANQAMSASTALSTTASFFPIHLPTTMRATPTGTFSATGDFKLTDGLGGTWATSVISIHATLSNRNVAWVDATIGSASLTTGRGVFLGANNTSSARITLTADL